MLTKGMTVTIKTHDSVLKHLNGNTGEIVRVIDTPDDTHDAEVLPMFVVNLGDNGHTEFWRDELTV